MMDYLGAARETLELAVEHEMNLMSSDKEHADYDHLERMVQKMETEPMSPTKACRWLGWVQACVYNMCDNVTLDHMKEINRRHSDD